MKARLLMGLAITFDNEDKESLKKTNTLECSLSDFPNYSEAQDRLRYDIYLDREVIEKLLSSSRNDFLSRSLYDWFNFNYYDC